MARSRRIAPYPSPAPSLYDPQVPQLREQDHRDAYDGQFRVNNRLRRWGIEIADIINALDIGGWDPSTKIIWVGDGVDADYTTIAEAIDAASPSSFDPRIVVVFPGTYFDKIYVPPYAHIYGIGGPGAVKIHVEAEDGTMAIKLGGNNSLYNVEIKQTKSSASNTSAVEAVGWNIYLHKVFIENLSTQEDSETLVIDGVETGNPGKVWLEHVRLKGNNANEKSDTFVEWTVEGNESYLWTGNDATLQGVKYNFNDQTANNIDGIGDSYTDLEVESPYPGGSSIEYENAGGNQFGDNRNTISLDPDDYTIVTGEVFLKVDQISATRENSVFFNMFAGSEGFVCRLSGTGEILFDIYVGLVAVQRVETGITFPGNGTWKIIGYYINTSAGHNEIEVYIDGKLEFIGTINTGQQIFGTGGASDLTTGTGSVSFVIIGDDAPLMNVANARFWGGDYRVELKHASEVAYNSTLRVGHTSTVIPTDVWLNDVHIENNKPTYNIVIGDVPIEMNGVHSRVSGVTNENTWVQTTKERSVRSLQNVTFTGGVSPLKIPIGTDLKIGPGCFFDRPIASLKTVEHTRGQIPQDISIANEHHVRATDDESTINIEAHGDTELGHVYPEPSVRWQPSIGVDGYIDLLETADHPDPPDNTLRIHAEDNAGFTFPHYHVNGDEIEISRDMIFVGRNTSGATITKGTPVNIYNATGNKPQLRVSRSSSESTMPAQGLMFEDVAHNAFGRVIGRGELRLDTSAFSEGDLLYVGDGALTNMEPTSPDHTQEIAVVITSGAGNGRVFVSPHTHINLGEPTLGAAGGTHDFDYDPEGFRYPEITHQFIPRLPGPKSEDFAVGDLTADGNYHILDLSSIVPKDAKAVALALYLKDDAVNNYFNVREYHNGSSAYRQNSLAIRTQAANVTQYNNGIVAFTRPDRWLEYAMANTTFTAAGITVVGWFI